MKYVETKKVLNQLVADLSQMSVVIHQIHWYLRGPEFLTLHPLMDEYMEEINEQLDVVSERLITLDGSPFSTLKEFAENTGIKDEVGNWDRTVPERMEQLVAGYRYLADLYSKGIEVAGEEGDDSTQDIFIANKTDIEKKIWMVQAKLGKAPGIDA
ncbi:starvation-inducible DNA-binding protein [Enterococcus sp. PF1-24]|uniref:Dps family protein n=1 Tax=unclassified Enterococcus TaxID=2608891 RepID=UPI0024730305|nr:MULTISPECIES: Dps family protein [unclassified Enterococcus]MDH6363460.1 starvation-inducible DNA-binding protein [Enterococcus sp. PFB1-1]MDH6400554.1 starvation-inducible DNA-binding protein [Enterococcus sp. PF1-24]